MYIHICTYLYVYTYIYVYISTYIHTHTRFLTHNRTHTHILPLSHTHKYDIHTTCAPLTKCTPSSSLTHARARRSCACTCARALSLSHIHTRTRAHKHIRTACIPHAHWWRCVRPHPRYPAALSKTRLHDCGVNNSCVTWLIHKCDVTYLYVWCDLFIWAKCCAIKTSLHDCGMTHSYVCHDSSIRVMWLVHKSDVTHSRVWCDWFICACPLPRCFAALSKPELRGCDMTDWYVWFDALICVTWLIHMCDVTYLYVPTLQLAVLSLY